MGYCMKKILQIILLILIFLCTLIILSKVMHPNKTANLFGLKAFVIKTETMQPTIKKGDLVITKGAKFDELDIDDVIVFNMKNSYNVIQTVREVKENKIITSSNVKQNKKAEVKEDMLQGKYLFKIPFLGNIVLFIKSIYGIIITTILIIFLLYKCITQKRCNAL